jgi:hypothetical protein
MTPQTPNETASGLWPIFGFAAFVFAWGATWSVVFAVSESDYEAGGEQLREALQEGSREILWRGSAVTGFIGAGFLVPFAMGLRRAIEARIGTDAVTPRVLEISMLATAATLAVGFVFRVLLFDSIDEYGPDYISTMYDLSVDVPLTAWAPMLLAVVSAAVLSLHQGALPKWFGYASVVLAILGLLALIVGPPVNIPVGLWLLLSSFASLSLRDSS